MNLFLEMITPNEVEILARYHAERNRGIVHTEEWQTRMVWLQQRFDQNERRRLEHMGAEFLPDGSAIIPPAPKRRRWWSR